METGERRTGKLHLVEGEKMMSWQERERERGERKKKGGRKKERRRKEREDDDDGDN